VGLKDRLTHRPSQMSGGEQQRVALIRALATRPPVVLGDEPTGNLDSTTGNRILQFLIELHKREKKTLVIVSHDNYIASKADQLITIKDGRLIQDHGIHRALTA
jgi:putative ABC transport system ATP-binding protein